MAINRPHGLTINDVIEYLRQKQPQITDAFGRIQSVVNDLWRQLSDVSDILDNTDLGDLPNNANVWLNGVGAFSNAQTPWNSNIAGGGFTLSDISQLNFTGVGSTSFMVNAAGGYYDEGAGGAHIVARGHPTLNIGELGTLTNSDQTVIVNSMEQFRVIVGGAIKFANLPNAAPAGGSKQIWYDPADGNRVKFVP